MCGITGFLGGGRTVDLAATVRRMADALAARGPDDSGSWVDDEPRLAFGHRRLSIVDLSPAGHQPMVSASGRFVIAFNGEIYNHNALRERLDAERKVVNTDAWRGHSDTETLLAGIEAWGLKETLRRCVGMFAIAVWDRREQMLSLARDRFGEKPLYYGWVGQGDQRAFAFASELKALRQYPAFNNPVSRQALTQYMRFMYVPAPLSIYRSIYKLEPGCMLHICADAVTHEPTPPIRPPAERPGLSLHLWWSMSETVEAGQFSAVKDERDALALLEDRLKESVALQSIADVPLGAFLSGGVDSSLIAALMQQQAGSSVKTFTVGFEEAGFDESPHARAVADHLGTEHTELFVTAEEARAVISRLPQMYDEPFADSSQIPTFLVCQAARQHVTVALSGDAGDELFGGYNRHFWGPRIWNKLAWLPRPVRRTMGRAIHSFPVSTWDRVGRGANRLVRSESHGVANLGDKAHKLGSRLARVASMDDLYMSLVTEWPAMDGLVLDDGTDLGYLGSLSDPLPGRLLDVSQEAMMYRDSVSYLPDDILCKVDRAAMATSLETRVPFLDHRVAELAWRLPLRMKIRDNVGKWALREILYKHVPRELIERPKAGFGIPVGQWLRGPLRDWAEALLSEERLQREGYLHPGPIRAVWDQHLNGNRDWTPRLWSVLMFQAWFDSQATR